MAGCGGRMVCFRIDLRSVFQIEENERSVRCLAAGLLNIGEYLSKSTDKWTFGVERRVEVTIYSWFEFGMPALNILDAGFEV